MKSDVRSKIRRLVGESLDDPTMLLFGYRWVYMGVLQSGNVKFADDKRETEDASNNDKKAPKTEEANVAGNDGEASASNAATGSGDNETSGMEVKDEEEPMTGEETAQVAAKAEEPSTPKGLNGTTTSHDPLPKPAMDAVDVVGVSVRTENHPNTNGKTQNIVLVAKDEEEKEPDSMEAVE